MRENECAIKEETEKGLNCRETGRERDRGGSLRSLSWNKMRHYHFNVWLNIPASEICGRQTYIHIAYIYPPSVSHSLPLFLLFNNFFISLLNMMLCLTGILPLRSYMYYPKETWPTAIQQETRRINRFYKQQQTGEEREENDERGQTLVRFQRAQHSSACSSLRATCWLYVTVCRKTWLDGRQT